MKSKISIWDCRRAIEIAGGLPVTIRGDLFAEPGPHPVARWISETVHVTQLEVKQGRWVIGNIGFTRHGQEHLTKLAQSPPSWENKPCSVSETAWFHAIHFSPPGLEGKQASLFEQGGEGKGPNGTQLLTVCMTSLL